MFRGIQRRPGFAAIAVLTLALGIGANTAIFSVVNGVLLRPLPYEHPERVAMIYGHWNLKNQAELSESEYWDMREQARSFERLAASADGSANLTGSGAPERLLVGVMTADALPLLGVAPALGRSFSAAEDLPNQPPVVLLGDGLWRRRFGGDRAIIGHRILLDDVATTVIGVLPPGFQLPQHYAGASMEAWMPLGLDPATDRNERGFHYLSTIGRLREGTSVDDASREVSALMTRMKATYPDEYAADFNGSAAAVTDQVTGSAHQAEAIGAEDGGVEGRYRAQVVGRRLAGQAGLVAGRPRADVDRLVDEVLEAEHRVQRLAVRVARQVDDRAGAGVLEARTDSIRRPIPCRSRRLTRPASSQITTTLGS